MQTCLQCESPFAPYPVVDGERLNLRGRQRCLQCLPRRPQRRPRKPVPRPVRVKTCESCGQEFPSKVLIDGKLRSLQRRRFCLTCSPFGLHNTSKFPPRIGLPEDLKEHRRRRRNAKIYRCNKRRQRRRRAELISLRGGRCEACGYDAVHAALEFHHRDPETKVFSLANFHGSWVRLLLEAAKCDLLCANCHRLRHAREERTDYRVTQLRRETRARAIERMGGACVGCGRDAPPLLFEFHHRKAQEKDFGIGEDGVVRPWDTIVAELAKCVMLCANCHREVHAGVRELPNVVAQLAVDEVTHHPGYVATPTPRVAATRSAASLSIRARARAARSRARAAPSRYRRDTSSRP